MSAESITIVISAAGLLLGFVGAFAWMIRRTDDQFAALRGDITAVRDGLRGEIDVLRTDLRGEIDVLRTDFGGRLTSIEHELVEVKITIARWEGPPRQLLPVR